VLYVCFHSSKIKVNSFLFTLFFKFFHPILFFFSDIFFFSQNLNFDLSYYLISFTRLTVRIKVNLLIGKKKKTNMIPFNNQFRTIYYDIRFGMLRGGHFGYIYYLGFLSKEKVEYSGNLVVSKLRIYIINMCSNMIPK